MDDEKKDGESLYRTWLVTKLVYRDPKVSEAFRLRTVNEILLPDMFSEQPGINIINDLYRRIMAHGDYDQGVAALAVDEKIICIPANDGVNHINVYSKGLTKLGRGLSNFASIPFDHPVDGRCASVEGYWYFLKTGRLFPHLKELSGINAKKEGKKYPSIELSDFIIQIKQAITCKILQNDKLREDVKASTLPFVHYYVYYGALGDFKVIPVGGDQWMMEHLEAIRADLRESIE